jgi:hypothetical protein
MNNGERKERRGFASMSPKQREIASKGGRAAHKGRRTRKA